MRVLSLSHPTQHINGTILLPSSKSISNRVLILKQIVDSGIELLNLSDADDTVLMQLALSKKHGTVNLKNAGTCMRFLTAFFAATQDSEIILLCDERMEKRPIKELVNVLRQLGAEIEYINKEGFPPLKIKGKQLNGGQIQISASASSQFVSALMMIAPRCKTDLTIELTGAIASQPYIDMTASLMNQFGISTTFRNNIIRISTSNIKRQTSNIFVESDWSAASYWYAMVALSAEAEILLPDLSLESLQGDSRICSYMEFFGVQTISQTSGVLLKKQPSPPTKPAEMNLVNEPDLAPTLAVIAAATHTPIVLTGLQNLAIKESNRLLALETELNKFGFRAKAINNSLQIHGTYTPVAGTPVVHTYGDHRMAMAFTPLALLFDQIIIQDPGVTEKSYPHFWKDIQSVGFSISHTG
jgi:3-phosphoshikimate 1-carboxyvinyltransferase